MPRSSSPEKTQFHFPRDVVFTFPETLSQGLFFLHSQKTLSKDLVFTFQGFGFHFPKGLVFTFPRVWFLLSQGFGFYFPSKHCPSGICPFKFLGFGDLVTFCETFVNSEGVDFGIWRFPEMVFGETVSWDLKIQFLGI